MNELIVLQRGRTRLTVAPLWRPHRANRAARWAYVAALLHDETLTPIDARDPLSWGCFPIAPWPNRIAGGRFEFDDRSYDASVSDGFYALHGLTFDRPWDVVKQEENLAVMQLSLTGSAWPWHASCSHSISVFDDGLWLEIGPIDGRGDVPAGAGWHPWFRRDVRPGHDVRVQIDSDRVYELNAMIRPGDCSRWTNSTTCASIRGWENGGSMRVTRILERAPRIRWETLS